MLVLTRKAGETIQAGDVTITVLGFIAGRVRLGIDAPDDTKILRGELIQQVQQETLCEACGLSTPTAKTTDGVCQFCSDDDARRFHP